MISLKYFGINRAFSADAYIYAAAPENFGVAAIFGIKICGRPSDARKSKT